MNMPETTIRQATGLKCPNCGQILPVNEGERIVRCPHCDIRSLVVGKRGVQHWQVLRRIEREGARQAVTRFFSGIRKASSLAREAKIDELFLTYLPFWHVKAYVSGWTFGRKRSGKDSTKPVEVKFEDELFWTDAAVDVAEFGVHRVSFQDSELELYDSERLHAEGLVFEPSESDSEAVKEALDIFRSRGRARGLTRRYFERFHFLQQRLSLVYYPLWVARYTYKGRRYQVVVDGRQGDVLYGKAPGNILYRALVLVGGMALGNLILVDGTAMLAMLASGSDEGKGLAWLLLPVGAGIGMIVAAYRAFRYGEEVEDIKQSARKEIGVVDGESLLRNSLKMLEEL